MSTDRQRRKIRLQIMRCELRALEARAAELKWLINDEQTLVNLFDNQPKG